jgi:hypothetical protein
MIEWYFRIHSWNRIALGGLVVAPAAKAIFGTLTIAHMIGLPLVAAVMWACGWAAIGGWNMVRNQRGRLHMLDILNLPAGSKV